MRKTPLTLGVLSMVFGGLTAAYSAIGFVFSAMSSSFISSIGALAARAPQRPGQPDPTLMFSRMGEVTRQLAPYTNSLLAGKLLFSAALITIGFGLYRRQRWGRSGALAWSALALAYLGAELLVRISIIQPRINEALREIFASTPNGAPGGAMMNALRSTQTTMSILVLLIFYAPFPLVLLAPCGRRSAAADFVD